MPKPSKYSNHKGRNRKFSSPEELERDRLRDEKNRNRKIQNHDLLSSNSEEESEDDQTEVKSGSGSETDSDNELHASKAKGVEGLITIENPNRVQKKMVKVTTVKDNDKPQLSRREREELDRQRAAQHYQKLHAEGKTEEARADLARLAIIKQQREEAAKKREQEKIGKETTKQTKTPVANRTSAKN